MTRPSAQELVETLRLARHPEGGFFRETYRASESIARDALPARFGGARAFGTAIYFLIEDGDFSALHHIASDEVWHFYLGDPLSVVEIDAHGRLTETLLGHDVGRGERPQHVVLAGNVFGARLAAGGAYALVGCTVAPGFDFADFALSERRELCARFPTHARTIEDLTRR